MSRELTIVLMFVAFGFVAGVTIMSKDLNPVESIPEWIAK